MVRNKLFGAKMILLAILILIGFIVANYLYWFQLDVVLFVVCLVSALIFLRRPPTDSA